MPPLAPQGFYPQKLTHHFQPSLRPWLHYVTGLSHHPPGQRYQLLVAVLHALLVGLSEALAGTADLQQTMLHGAPVIHHFQGSVLPLAGDALQTAAEHSDAVAQKAAVGGVVNVALDA